MGKQKKLIHFQSKWLEVIDYRALAAMADFDPGYLYYDESSKNAIGM